MNPNHTSPGAYDRWREAMRTRARRCHYCRGMETRVEDGAACGGLAGLKYKVCGACGHTEAKGKTKQ